MNPTGGATEGGLIIVTIFVMNLIYRKHIRTGVPRARVIFLCIICTILWICCFALSLIDTNHNHSMLWMTLNLLSMAATLFVMFIALSEIMQNPTV